MSNLTPINKLTPFGRFCTTIGNLPSSYMESLTYEEQLLWFCNFLQNEVIPTVNNNADAVEELQNLFVELKNYVDNYFENLDVQEEINNKLDEMAESGSLLEIITPFIQNEEIARINADNNLQNQINVEKARIDNITQLEDGSTSGDAELQDIRIGENGITYNTAGNAVRRTI